MGAGRPAARRRRITADDLPSWWKAVEGLADEGSGAVYRAYRLTLLLTGLRKSEGAGLRVRHVDLKAGTLTPPDPKNRQPHTVPMGAFLHSIVHPRGHAATGAWTFPSAHEGHVFDPRKAVDYVVNTSGGQFTPHDHRWTFATIAESLDIRGYTRKRLLNHKTETHVTAGGITPVAERLRGPIQCIKDEILSRAGYQFDRKLKELRRKRPPRRTR